MVWLLLLGCGGMVAPSKGERPQPEQVAAPQPKSTPEFRWIEHRRMVGLCEPSGAVLQTSGLWIGEDDGLDYLLTSALESDRWTEAKRVSLSLRSQGLLLDDIEGATLAGSEVWWTTSVSRNRPDRAKMVWMDGTSADARGVVDLMPWRQEGAFEALVRAVNSRCDLPDDLHDKKPKRGGLDIEGLAASGDALYLGLRGPLTVDGAAVLVQVDRQAAQDGRPASELISDAWCIDLGGRGIRSLTADPGLEGRFLGVAGDVGSGGDFDLFAWTPGSAAEIVARIPTAEHTSPEALVVSMDGGVRVGHILFDEGTRVQRETGCDCATVLAGDCPSGSDGPPDVQVATFRW